MEISEQQILETQREMNELARERDEAIDTVHDATRNVNSIFQTPENENIIQWQLDLQEQLNNIGHSLRGHIIEEDGKGNSIWQESEEKDDIIFTEYGVQEILRFLLQYLNKNTILSNYSEEIINQKVFDAGWVLADLVFNRYERFLYVTPRDILLKRDKTLTEDDIEKIHGEQRKEKLKHYESSLRPVIDAIHSAYLRALNGGERESLRSARILTQTENPNMMKAGLSMIPNAQPKRSIFKPTTWF